MLANIAFVTILHTLYRMAKEAPSAQSLDRVTVYWPISSKPSSSASSPPPSSFPSSLSDRGVHLWRVYKAWVRRAYEVSHAACEARCRLILLAADFPACSLLDYIDNLSINSCITSLPSYLLLSADG